jgi:hypothetical protein
VAAPIRTEVAKANASTRCANTRRQKSTILPAITSTPKICNRRHGGNWQFNPLNPDVKVRKPEIDGILGVVSNRQLGPDGWNSTHISSTWAACRSSSAGSQAVQSPDKWDIPK